jgi:maltooligosyltrehalose synthase
VPVPATGRHAGHAVALGRLAPDDSSFVAGVATRGARALAAGRDDLPVGPRAWQDTLLVLPERAPEVLVDALTGRSHESEPHGGGYPGRLLALSEVLRDLPVALLVGSR